MVSTSLAHLPPRSMPTTLAVPGDKSWSTMRNPTIDTAPGFVDPSGPVVMVITMTIDADGDHDSARLSPRT